jgi:hypothetical protein
MSDEEIPLLERVASYYSQLSTVAADLNAVSDELGKSISEIDIALKKLNLGITTWVTIHSSDEDHPHDDFSFWAREIGYAKIDSKWGISLRKVDGDCRDPDEATIEQWLFNDAPRSLRLEAIDKIPELLEKLSKEAVKTTKNIRARLSEAQAVAEAVKGAANASTKIPIRIPIRPLTTDTSQNRVQTVGVGPAPAAPNLDAVRQAVIIALEVAGHDSAAEIIDKASWTLDGDTFCIRVSGIGRKMLALTVNAAAEKIIRQETLKWGARPRFQLASDSGVVVNIPPNISSKPLKSNSTEVK